MNDLATRFNLNPEQAAKLPGIRQSVENRFRSGGKPPQPKPRKPQKPKMKPKFPNKPGGSGPIIAKGPRAVEALGVRRKEDSNAY